MCFNGELRADRLTLASTSGLQTRARELRPTVRGDGRQPIQIVTNDVIRPVAIGSSLFESATSETHIQIALDAECSTSVR